MADGGRGQPEQGESPAKRARKDDGFTLGGHDGGVRPDGSAADSALVLKAKQAGANGVREEDFLRSAVLHPFLSRFAVRYVETRRYGDQEWLVLENVMAGMQRPAGLDLKMGTRTHGDDAAPEKVAEQTGKARESTTSTLGIRVVGCRRPSPDGRRGDEVEGSKYKKEPADEHEMRQFLRRFFPTPALLLQARAAAADLEYWFSQQTDWAFYGSSLLFAFDAADPGDAVLRVKMIDFAHAHCVTGRYQQDSSYLDGLRSLQRCLCDLPPIPGSLPDASTAEWALARLRHHLHATDAGTPERGGGGGGCVVFLRHGQTDKATDSSIEADLARALTRHGRAQAAAAADWLDSLQRLPGAGPLQVRRDLSENSM